ncbi:unnamed protein product [Macrosiphum euphorbiae]|nr:unnamed protein product [Macrosiphum euphorbiae]
MFQYVYQIAPHESMYDIIYSGSVTHVLKKKTRAIDDLTLLDFTRELDAFFGEGFSKVCARPLTHLYYEYMTKLRYYNYGETVTTPSAQDYVDLYRFIKCPVSKLTAVTEYILSRNNIDYKTPLQQQVKICY